MMRNVLTKRLNIRGFIVSDFAARHGDFLRDMSQWVREGKVKHREFVTEGLDSAPAAFMGLLERRQFRQAAGARRAGQGVTVDTLAASLIANRSVSTWPGARTWRTSKLSGWKTYSTSPTSLMPMQFLPRVGLQDEAGRRRPDVADAAPGEVAPLVHVPAGHQPQIDAAEHLDQAGARRLRDVADRCGRQFRIVRRIQEQRLVDEQRQRPSVQAGELFGQPVELFLLACQRPCS